MIYCLHGVSEAAPTAGGVPNRSHFAAKSRGTLVLPANTVPATDTVAPPPSTFINELTQLLAVGTLIM